MKDKKKLLAIAGISVLALTMMACGLLGLVRPGEEGPTPFATPLTEVQPTPTPLPPSVISAADAEEQLLINLYKRVSPAVVNISVEDELQLFPTEGTASGFVIDKEGHIVTNNHVVADAREITVKFSDKTVVEAWVIGRDPGTDLAVIAVDVPSEMLYPVVLGDSSTLQVGQRAIAIGNPFGLERTLTVGFISYLGRVVQLEDRFSLPELIQTDAAINPGNSGGPLLNSEGEVIGVNTLIFSRTGASSGVGFAVPVNVLKRVIPSLIEGGSYEHPWLGIIARTVDADLAEAVDLPVQKGVLVIEVVRGGPSARAGLRGGQRSVVVDGMSLEVGGDIIVAIDGQEVRDFDDLVTYLAQETRVGQTVDLTVMRNGREHYVQVKLGERPERVP
ncbi:MAG: S1C family serine protease [Anaerolineae bacterium]